MSPRRKRMGRPPAGDDGEKVGEYARMTVRMKLATKDRLQAASSVTKLPVWRIVEQSFGQFLEKQSDDDRRAIESLTRKLKRARQH